MQIKYFKIPQCSLCYAIEPKIKQLAEKYNIPFESIDLNEKPHIRGQFLLFTAPAIIFMDGNKERKRFIRNFALSEVKTFIEQTI